MPRLQIALPSQPQDGSWDSARGGFRLAGNPEWDRMRAAYDRQLAAPRPIVHEIRKPWRDRLRNALRLGRWALHVFFRGRP